jgi:carboxypeptidase PM20D1
LAAIELLIQHKITPPRTVYLALGHDEEIGGKNGAAYIAKYLTEQPNFKQFEFILDEGSMIVKGGVPGFTSHVAMISTSEKGYVTVYINMVTIVAFAVKQFLVLYY